MSDEELHDCLEALTGEANTRYTAIPYLTCHNVKTCTGMIALYCMKVFTVCSTNLTRFTTLHTATR
jgi:hypothetical protein